MDSMNNKNSIECWLDAVQDEFSKNAPDLLSLFTIYAEEAKFGRVYIDSDLKALAQSVNILEVGAGSLLLSCQLIREGFQVTSIEPIGSGFSHFDRMRDIVLKVANDLSITPKILDIHAEKLTINDYFDYAFSINVMEHVDDVEQVITAVGNSLNEKAFYRFTCPNYLFPYEPHFNIPTLFSKQLTEKIFYKKIFFNGMDDPKGMWESLNWITVPLVKRVVESRPYLSLKFNRSILTQIFTRVVADKALANRRSPIVMSVIRIIVFFRFHFLFSAIPVSCQPAMDCVIIKFKSLEAE
jgi:SAM-dependent methyltransferase